MKLKERKKISLSLSITALSLAVLAWPHTTKALFGESIAGTIGHSILWVITLIIDLIGGFVITIAASLLNYVWRFQSFIKVPAVQIGWTMSRDLANMGFILIMLTMAFGTILRIDTYGWKKLLPKLIFVALLINFSLIIGGIFIDIGNSLGLFFVSGGDQEAGTPQVGDFIMTAMASGKWAQLRNEISTAGDAVSTLVMGSIVQLIFYMIMAFLLLALGFIMIFRMINLWILLMLAPLAWISYALPKGSNYWGQWWSKFLNWAFFPAIMGFFIFLGLLVGASFQGGSFAGPTDVGGWGWLFPESLFASVMQFIAVVAILFMGLLKAKSLSGAGADIMMKGVGKMQNWTAGKIKMVAKSPLKVPGLAYRGADKLSGGRIGAEVSRLRTTAMERLEKAPLIGRAVGGPGTRYAAQQKELGTAADKFKGLRPNDIEARLKQAALTPEGLQDRAGMIKTLIDKGQFSLDTKPEFEKTWPQMLQTFQNSGGNIIDLIKRRPDLAYNADIQKMISRDVNAPPPVKAKWQKILGEQDQTKKDTAINSLLSEDIIKTAADFAGIQKESLDMKGKLEGGKKDQYEGLEKQTDILRKLFLMQEERDDKKSKDKDAEAAELEKGMEELRKGLDGTNKALSGLTTATNITRTQYSTAIKGLQQQRIDVSGHGSQDKIAAMFLEELKRDGKLYAGSLNQMASKNRDAHLNFLKYLKAAAPGMQGELKDDVYKHATAGLVMNTMVDQTSPPTT